MPEYILHSRGENWFHFRRDPRSLMESFSVTYCHDGSVCITGDMGCLVWQRGYFPKMPDYGFPYSETGIEYFAEKVVRAGDAQSIRAWDKDLAISEIDIYMRDSEYDTDIGALQYVSDWLQHAESNEFYHQKMMGMFDDEEHEIEEDAICTFGVDYSKEFKMRYDLLRGVSHLIAESVAVGGVR